MSKQPNSASTSQQDDHALSVKDLTQGNLLGHLYRLALPIMGTSFVQMAYSFTDMAWLGRLSSEAVAAVGTISVFLWIAQSVAYFNKTGSEVTIGQSIGRKALDEARLYASHNTTLSIGISILLAVGYCLLAPVLVELYRPSHEVGALALEYMYVVLWGLPASFLTFTLFGIYNATGNSSVPFRILSLGLVCNIVLDPILIHLLGWGVSGAAWATIISQYLVLGLFLYRLRVRDRLLSGFPLVVRLSWKPSWRIITIGLPAASLNVLFAIVAIYMGRLASTAGGHIGIAVLTTGGAARGADLEYRPGSDHCPRHYRSAKLCRRAPPTPLACLSTSHDVYPLGGSAGDALLRFDGRRPIRPHRTGPRDLPGRWSLYAYQWLFADIYDGRDYHPGALLWDGA